MASKGTPKSNPTRPKNRLFPHIALHLALMSLVGTGLLLLFFYVFLPIITHHGQSITVPSLVGSSLEEVEIALTQRHLRFKITDETAYIPEYAPMTVLQQYPRAGTKVKKGRKIYLTINSQTPPQVAMPNLVDGSVRNAKALLTNKGLLLGKVRYVSDIAQNAVLEQWHQGEKITPGTLVGKGSKIDLVVGAGLSKKQVEVPDVIGMRLEEAKFWLLSTGIKVGNIIYKTDSPEALPGTIWQQVPTAGQQVYRGESVDLWLVALPEEELAVPDAPLLPGS